MQGYVPEPPPQQEEEPAKLAIRVQAELLGRLPDDAARLRWIETHADDFRKKFEADESFRAMAKAGDLDGLERALGERLN